jgi:hypothetical protein
VAAPGFALQLQLLAYPQPRQGIRERTMTSIIGGLAISKLLLSTEAFVENQISTEWGTERKS